MVQDSLYKQIISITADYLGPAAPRFIDRQIEGHLHIRPEQIKVKDLELLIEWIKLSVALLTDDAQIRHDYENRLRKLMGQKSLSAK